MRAAARLIAVAGAWLAGHAFGGADALESPAGTPGGLLLQDTVQVDTLSRSFAVYVPSTALPPAPVVLAFHGGSGGSGARLRGFIGAELEGYADGLGFLVVWADGYGGSWNDCRAGASHPANVEGIDDPAFVRALVARLVDGYGADPDAVYALGYSNGAHLAYRLALEAPGTVRAVAAFGANLPADDALDCGQSGRPLPVLMVTGTEDPINPYAGGEVRLPDGTYLGRVRSAPETAAYFARLAGYERAGRLETLVPPDSVTEARVERTRWTGGGPEVSLVTVHGGGHTIPGPDPRFPEFLGPAERRFDAVREAVLFFLR